MKSQNFSPDWPELGFIRAELGLNMKKKGSFQKPGVVLYSFNR